MKIPPVPRIYATPYCSFVTPEGQYIDIFYGTVTKTYIEKHDIRKYNITDSWWGDKDIRDGYFIEDRRLKELKLTKSHAQ